jgi:hypothetical protein
MGDRPVYVLPAVPPWTARTVQSVARAVLLGDAAVAPLGAPVTSRRSRREPTEGVATGLVGSPSGMPEHRRCAERDACCRWASPTGDAPAAGCRRRRLDLRRHHPRPGPLGERLWRDKRHGGPPLRLAGGSALSSVAQRLTKHSIASSAATSHYEILQRSAARSESRQIPFRGALGRPGLVPVHRGGESLLELSEKSAGLSAHQKQALDVLLGVEAEPTVRSMSLDELPLPVTQRR